MIGIFLEDIGDVEGDDGIWLELADFPDQRFPEPELDLAGEHEMIREAIKVTLILHSTMAIAFACSFRKLKRFHPGISWGRTWTDRHS